ncbi:hypothetical protein ROZALSC1DRAFT_20410 [Rozella allomycis CSF55]|uniref:Uncharacterized protein n=1 Tax=Rozella allomycis (strain CSF55) TaxID=988480 RepID=A0A4P9YQK9_ROZAC|nr:hypothetical protein ROZALSC1DRAFT_20410 [Rozella allomycis CSF55]
MIECFKDYGVFNASESRCYKTFYAQNFCVRVTDTKKLWQLTDRLPLYIDQDLQSDTNYVDYINVPNVNYGCYYTKKIGPGDPNYILSMANYSIVAQKELIFEVRYESDPIVIANIASQGDMKLLLKQSIEKDAYKSTVNFKTGYIRLRLFFLDWA